MKKNLGNLLVAFVVAIFIFIFNNLPSKSDTLKFVQLSDIHYSAIRPDNAYKALSRSKDLINDAVNQINGIPNVDFVIVTGDGIDAPLESSANDLFGYLNKLKYPWYYAIGNHDTAESATLNKKRFIEMLQQNNPSFKFDKAYYSFVPKHGFKVIVLEGDDEGSCNGFIPPEELQWLDSELESAKHDIVLIFLHFPLLEPFPSTNHRILDSDEFYAVLNKYKNPIGIFTGHYHTTKITRVNNIIHVSTPALVGYPNAFRLVSVTNYRHKAIFDFYFYETKLKDVQQKAKLQLFGSSSYYGTEKDRSTTIVIDK